MESSIEIKEVVRSKYKELALANSGCGCGSFCDCNEPGSSDSATTFHEDYTTNPGYVKEADLGLGCGIPIDYADIKNGDYLLDLGSGAGNDCFIALPLVGKSGKVVGLDFTDEMLEKANRNKMTLSVDNVEFVKGDIEDIPLNDNTFDVVVSNCVLNLVPDKVKAFNEVKRVLKHGGHFCVSDIVLEGELPLKIRNVAALYAGCVSGALQKNDYINIIKNAGFKNVEIKKERQYKINDSIFLEYVSEDILKEFRNSGAGIYSITVVGTK